MALKPLKPSKVKRKESKRKEHQFNLPLPQQQPQRQPRAMCKVLSFPD